MKRALILLLLAFCLAGCGQRGARAEPGGAPGEPGSRRAAPRLLLAPSGQGESARAAERLLREGRFGYRLKKAAPIGCSGQALLLRYRAAGGERNLRVYGPDGQELVRRPMPAAPGSTVFLYAALPQGSRLQGFEILPGPGSEAHGLQLLGAEIASSFAGAAVFPAELHLGSLVSSLAGDGRALELRFSLPPAGSEALWQIELQFESLKPPPRALLRRLEDAAFAEPGLARPGLAGEDATLREGEDATLREGEDATLREGEDATLREGEDATLREGEDATLREGEDATLREGEDATLREGEDATLRAQVALTFSGQGQSRSFRHSALSGKQRLFIYAGLLPFVPEELRIEPLAGGLVWLEHLGIARLPGGGPGAAGSEGLPGALEPLEADPGAVLHYDPARWRQKDYELYSWQRYPQILIMDTADYAVQSRFFKRLAFFVEKRGYRGRLLADGEFAALHGFNAHDYRAEDLARFFQTAREQSFPLNPEERLLERILLANGIIHEQGAILAGRGAILSISRGSNPQLRQHLLTHECLHGLFFSLSDFRRAAFEAWEQLSEQARAYWELFFGWVGYDTEDPYLVVNEFQAYLLQQPREEVDYYFRSLTSGRLISSYPDREQEIRRFMAAEPPAFLESFDRLERALRELAGLEAGRVVELQPLQALSGK